MPELTGLSRDPKVKKHLSESYDDTLDSLTPRFKATAKDPCVTSLFLAPEYDHVAFFNTDSKHLTVCRRSPKLTKKEAQLQAGRIRRALQTESPEAKAMRNDVCERAY